MKQHTFSKDSWHYKLANTGAKRIWDFDEIDICSYIRKVLAGCIVVLAATFFCLVLITVFGYGYITFGIWMFDCITTGIWVWPNPVACMTMISTVLVAAIAGFAKALDVLSERRFLKSYNKVVPPSFLSLVYRKFKSKTCFKIKFE